MAPAWSSATGRALLAREICRVRPRHGFPAARRKSSYGRNGPRLYHRSPDNSLACTIIVTARLIGTTAAGDLLLRVSASLCEILFWCAPDLAGKKVAKRAI